MVIDFKAAAKKHLRKKSAVTCMTFRNQAERLRAHEKALDTLCFVNSIAKSHVVAMVQNDGVHIHGPCDNFVGHKVLIVSHEIWEFCSEWLQSRLLDPHGVTKNLPGEIYIVELTEYAEEILKKANKLRQQFEEYKTANALGQKCFPFYKFQ